MTSAHIRVSNNGTSDGTYRRGDGSGKTNQRDWYETLRSLVSYGVEHSKFHIYAHPWIILYEQRDREWLALISAFLAPCISPEFPFSHSLLVFSNSCHFKLFFDHPERSKSRLQLYLLAPVQKNLFGAKMISKVFNFIKWIPLQFFKAQTNKKKRLVQSWPNVVCFSSSENTFTKKKCTIYNF